ncbi:MAG: tRNA adenosine(34) deaminase TadA [Clostridiales Family XIII bacterium]|nr:tRNA adenosine(34) deaminase TadA [Clostridiales Family XIII bacterium]
MSEAGETRMQRETFMGYAIEEAKKAAREGEVPIGAVIVKDGEVVGRGYNRIETGRDPTLHAELIAIRAAAKTLGARRLIGCTLYVTAEPCSMCAGAAVLARVDAIVAGCESDKSGGCGTVKDILESEDLNHRVAYTVGVRGEECAKLLREFFRELRETKREHRMEDFE